jgi:DUF971 family protein
MPDAVPVKLAAVPPDRLQIEWSDGARREYTYRELRDACPCASCREKRDAPPNPFAVLKPGEAQPLGIASMEPVGNYAYSILFKDGHDTGICTLDFLRQLGRDV